MTLVLTVRPGGWADRRRKQVQETRTGQFLRTVCTIKRFLGRVEGRGRSLHHQGGGGPPSDGHPPAERGPTRD